MKTLHLTLKKKWFDMILSGEKKEEYREIKMYWINRLLFNVFNSEIGFTLWYNSMPDHVTLNHVLKDYKQITFRNGYSKNAPEFTAELKNIIIDVGFKSWGAEPNKKYFVLKLGNIISTKNLHYENR